MSDSIVNPMPVVESKSGPAGHIKFQDGSLYQWGEMTATPEGTAVEFAISYASELSVVVAGGSGFGRRRWFRSAPRPVPVCIANGTPKGFTAYAAEPTRASYMAFGR